MSSARSGSIGAHRIVIATALGLALAGPALAQAPNVQQMLQGLTTGNQGQDQALRDAFERGYRQGRQDEARQQRSDRSGGDRSSRRAADEPYARDYQSDYERQGGSSNR
jgi:hypothetical protein